jgi:hypothetical protein
MGGGSSSGDTAVAESTRLLVDMKKLAVMSGWQEIAVTGTVPVARHVHTFTLIEGEDRAIL